MCSSAKLIALFDLLDIIHASQKRNRLVEAMVARSQQVGSEFSKLKYGTDTSGISTPLNQSSDHGLDENSSVKEDLPTDEVVQIISIEPDIDQTLRYVDPLDPRLTFTQEINLISHQSTEDIIEKSDDQYFCKRCIYRRNNIVKKLKSDNYDILCDVGLKSCMRSLRTFFKQRLAEFLDTKQGSNFEQFVDQLLLENHDNGVGVPSKNSLTLHLTALLKATSTCANKKKQARERKDQDIHQQRDLTNHIEFINQVLYKTNRKLVSKFLHIQANVFLLITFGREAKIEVAGKKNAPMCRDRELQHLLDFAKIIY